MVLLLAAILLATALTVNASNRIDAEKWVLDSLEPFVRHIDPFLMADLPANQPQLRAAGLFTSEEQRLRFKKRRHLVGIGALLGGVSSLLVDSSLLSMSILVLAGGCSALFADMWRLRRREAHFQMKLRCDFPYVVEQVALSAIAGESIFFALRRIALGSTSLARSLSDVVYKVERGEALMEVLAHWAHWYRIPGGERLVDALLISQVHGSPLAPLLITHAHEVREESRRALLEACGKSEIAMAVPVVFLILPVTVLFALYPSLAQLNLMAFG
ncbi:MAG: type II secretion system F family protein [Actinomycetes bacterium]